MRVSGGYVAAGAGVVEFTKWRTMRRSLRAGDAAMNLRISPWGWLGVMFREGSRATVDSDLVVRSAVAGVAVGWRLSTRIVASLPSS